MNAKNVLQAKLLYGGPSLHWISGLSLMWHWLFFSLCFLAGFTTGLMNNLVPIPHILKYKGHALVKCSPSVLPFIEVLLPCNKIKKMYLLTLHCAN